MRKIGAFVTAWRLGTQVQFTRRTRGPASSDIPVLPVSRSTMLSGKINRGEGESFQSSQGFGNYRLHQNLCATNQLDFNTVYSSSHHSASMRRYLLQNYLWSNFFYWFMWVLIVH